METKQRLIQTALNFDGSELDGEKNYGKSETLPDQTMGVREILSRYSRGLPLAGTRVPEYQGEEDNFIPDNYQHLDLAEQEEIRLQNEERIRQMQTDLAQSQKYPIKTVPPLRGAEGGEPSPEPGEGSE